MPAKTWEPPPFQADTDTRPEPARKAEPRNFEPAHGEHGSDPDATAERGQVEYEEINTDGSER